jgi:predicted HicB family RNase H-like nuclease
MASMRQAVRCGLNVAATICCTMKQERSTEPIMLRVPPALREEIERAAAEEGRSIANLTRRVLEHWAAERNSRQSVAA